MNTFITSSNNQPQSIYLSFWFHLHSIIYYSYFNCRNLQENKNDQVRGKTKTLTEFFELGWVIIIFLQNIIIMLYTFVFLIFSNYYMHYRKKLFTWKFFHLIFKWTSQLTTKNDDDVLIFLFNSFLIHCMRR